MVTGGELRVLGIWEGVLSGYKEVLGTAADMQNLLFVKLTMAVQAR